MTTLSKNAQIEAAKANWIEWLTGAVSTLMVAALIGWIAFEAVTYTQRPPELSVAVYRVASATNGYRVEFDIQNQADTTAAGVVVRGELIEGGEPVEEAEVTFDYVPSLSKTSGAMLFERDPGELEIRIRAVGYSEP